jgi:hypothetical protein
VAKKGSEPCAATVATEEYRRAFQANAVSGTPTVLINGWSRRTAAK